MSITRQEFETGLGRLAGMTARPLSPDRYELVPEAGGPAPVTVDFEELPKAVLGGLMALPRVRVTLDVSALPQGARADFVALFDRTFQRGGG